MTAPFSWCFTQVQGLLQKNRTFCVFIGLLPLFFLGKAYSNSNKPEEEKTDCFLLLADPKAEALQLAPLRAKTMKGWDRLFAWTLRSNHQPYPLAQPIQQAQFRFEGKHGKIFSDSYGYFSIYRPLVGVVSDSKRDIDVTRCLLTTIHAEMKNDIQARFATDEVLAKVLAYRDLEKGMTFAFSTIQPKGGRLLETYSVVEVLNLWRGMPAFVLIPEQGKKRGEPPLLLFRGTDLSITSEKGWASILSDLDPKGVGYTTFLKAQKQLENCLRRLKQEYGPVRLIGYSLGGAFALYTMIYYPQFLVKDSRFASVIYNPPGLSRQAFKQWAARGENEQPAYLIYVNEGDLVSKLGLLVNQVWQVGTDRLMEVIESHVTLMSVQDKCTLSALDVKRENQRRDVDLGRGP